MGDVLGCGVDIVEISRVAHALRRTAFARRVFSERERELLADKPVASWAVRFAAKEAVMKALGCGWQRGVGFSQIEIIQDKLGKPLVVLTEQSLQVATEQGIAEMMISLSHSKEMAIAYAIAVGRRCDDDCHCAGNAGFGHPDDT